MKKVFIFGAASAIARETAILFAKEKCELYLCDLKKSRVEAVKDHILTYAETTIHTDEGDALAFDDHNKFFQRALDKMGRVDVVLIAHGTLPDQEKTRKSADATVREFNINGLSIISLATIAANYFEENNRGTLAVISSVAGDRGRQSNYIYGSAKGAVSLFLQGLRNRLSETNVKILTIKPGMVDTPMTADMPKSPLFSKPEIIGKGIYEAIKNEKDIVYLPGFWRLVMLIIRLIPEAIFKKLKL